MPDTPTRRGRPRKPAHERRPRSSGPSGSASPPTPKEAVAQGMDLKATMAHARHKMDPKFANVFIYEHCLPFDVTRAHDEASGIRDPRIWTAQRDQDMWHALQS